MFLFDLCREGCSRNLCARASCAQPCGFSSPVLGLCGAWGGAAAQGCEGHPCRARMGGSLENLSPHGGSCPPLPPCSVDLPGFHPAGVRQGPLPVIGIIYLGCLLWIIQRGLFWSVLLLFNLLSGRICYFIGALFG